MTTWTRDKENGYPNGYPWAYVCRLGYEWWIEVQGSDCNISLLSKVLEHITHHPEEHDQGTWARTIVTAPCRTAMCLAGHAIVMTGHELVWSHDKDYAELAYLKDDPLNRFERIPIVARRELRLTSGNADTLFSAANNLDELWTLATAITDGAIQRPVT